MQKIEELDPSKENLERERRSKKYKNKNKNFYFLKVLLRHR